LTETKTSNKIGFFVRNQSIVVPIAAIFVAFFLGGILIFLQGVNPLVAYRAIFQKHGLIPMDFLELFKRQPL
jgi:ABC-type uncharacterized transport system permease subunit